MLRRATKKNYTKLEIQCFLVSMCVCVLRNEIRNESCLIYINA